MGMNFAPATGHCVLLLLFVSMVSCSNGKKAGEVTTHGMEKTVSDTGRAAITRDQAVATALKFLREQPYADQYLADSLTVHETETDWRVLILHVEWERRLPGVGLIEVDKKTGEARWRPLK